jgi:hypothetical protein
MQPNPVVEAKINSAVKAHIITEDKNSTKNEIQKEVVKRSSKLPNTSKNESKQELKNLLEKIEKLTVQIKSKK